MSTEPNIVLLGPGIFCAAQLPPGTLPDTVEIDCAQLLEGRYRLTRNGDHQWGDQTFPFFNYDRLGDSPEGAEMTPLQVLTI